MKLLLVFWLAIGMSSQASARVLFECTNLENGLRWSFEELYEPIGAFELVEYGINGERTVLFSGSSTFWSEATNMDVLIVYNETGYLWATLYYVYGARIRPGRPQEVVELVPSLRLIGAPSSTLEEAPLSLCRK